jgi:hypothetical protein
MRAITSAIPGLSQLHVFEVRYIANAPKGFIGEGESGKRRRNSRVDILRYSTPLVAPM